MSLAQIVPISSGVLAGDPFRFATGHRRAPIQAGRQFDPHERTPALDARQKATVELVRLVSHQAHRDLDAAIGRLQDDPEADELAIRRLKKRKLQLKDQIAQLEAQLVPDEPA